MEQEPSATPSKKVGKLSRERIIKLLVGRVQAIEFGWQDAEDRRKKLVELKNWLHELHQNKDVDLPYLTRLHEQVKADITLDQFYSLVVPIEREYDLLSISDKDFVVSSEDDEEAEASLMPVKVVLDSLRSAFNVGSIIRSSDCTGIEEIIACGYTAPPDHEKTAKAAMGAEQHVSWSQARDIKTATAELKKQGIPIIALETVDGAPTPHDFEFPFPCALLLGNERFGLNKQILEYADEVVSIPTYGVKNSLNVVSAFSVCAYEIRRQWEASQAEDHSPEETTEEEPEPKSPPKRLYRKETEEAEPEEPGEVQQTLF